MTKCSTISLIAPALVVATALVSTARAGAQRPAPVAAFEVASVKANRSGELAQRLQPSPGGRLTVTNVSLRGLVRFAYELQEFQMDGGPGWFATDRFDVVARAEGSPPIGEIRLMLRALLADRFKLRTHTEVRDQPVYALVMARNDKRLGKFGPPPGVPITAGRLAFRGMTLEAFATSLAPLVRRVVIDRTGLAGAYDAEFDATAELPPPPPPPGSGIPNPFDPRRMPSIFSVLPDQLGLKLESTRASVDVLVIDAAERPVDD